MDCVVGISAVGSMKEEIAPGHLARCVRTDDAARHAAQPLAA
jgi:purine nucleoside phosphorylase